MKGAVPSFLHFVMQPHVVEWQLTVQQNMNVHNFTDLQISVLIMHGKTMQEHCMQELDP